MKFPQVSIITPTYNQEKFLNFCIRSVINQSFQDWEMIIIDDNSIDKTYQVALNFSIKDKRIKVIRHEKNWGIKKLAETYNQALMFSRGKYIAILEGDDFWPKNKLSLQIKAMVNNNSVLSYGDWIFVSRSGKKIYRRTFDHFNQSYLENDPPPSILNLFLTIRFDILSPTVLIKKDALLKIGGFQNGKYYPFIDIPTYLALSKLGKFTYIKETLGYYRRTPNSAWFNFAKISPSFGRLQLCKEINNFVKNQTKKFSKKLNWSRIKKEQKEYLIFKRLISSASFVFNYFVSKV